MTANDKATTEEPDSKFLVFVHNVETGNIVNQFVTVAKDVEAAVENCRMHIDDLTQDAVAISAGKVHGSGASAGRKGGE